MNESASGDTDALRHDLHGETVGLVHTTPILECDYCDAVVGTTEPILFEALRVVDLPTLETLLDPPEGWILDAVRCRDCAIEQLDPATTGYDEALVHLAVTDTDGILSVDGSTLRVVDVSPSTDGYAPPRLGTHTLTESGDVGYTRWLRMRACIEHVTTAATTPPAAVDLLDAMLTRSTEVPPGITV